MRPDGAEGDQARRIRLQADGQRRRSLKIRLRQVIGGQKPPRGRPLRNEHRLPADRVAQRVSRVAQGGDRRRASVEQQRQRNDAVGRIGQLGQQQTRRGADGEGRLIERNLRLVVFISRRFENTGICLEDLISIGTIGLIKGISTFRVDRGIKLATYCSRCIENEILMHIRKTAGQKTEISLDEPINTDWDGNELLLSDILGTEEDVVMRPMEEDVERQLLREALSRLPERERYIISLRFGLCGQQERTQKEVADCLGISQSYISRLEKRIMQRLRRDILRQVS